MNRSYAFRRPVENTFLVRERDRLRLRELLVVAVLIVGLGGGLLTYTWVHIEILRTGYRVDELERELHHLLEVERRFRLEAASRSHPGQIEERAQAELGMQVPTLAQTVFYRELKP